MRECCFVNSRAVTSNTLRVLLFVIVLIASLTQITSGQYEIAVKPVEIKGGELMRLFNVALTPGSVTRRQAEAYRT